LKCAHPDLLWLPEKKTADMSNLDGFLADAYSQFKTDFIDNPLLFMNKPLILSEHKCFCKYGKTVFCHIAYSDHRNMTGVVEQNRIERIHWIKPILQNANDVEVKVWFKKHKSEKRVLLLVEKVSYLVVLLHENNKDRYKLITAYPVFPNNLRKLLGQYERFSNKKRKSS
jgi:hypothetical protein